MRASLPLLASALSLALASCLIYDESLLSGGAGGTGGDGGSGATGNQGGGGSGNQGGGGSGNQGGGGSGNQGGGGSGGCTNPSQCPGDDGDCQSRTCQGGVCGIMLVPMGTAIASQTAGDCKKLVCDGQGNVVSQDDDGDTPNDGKQCTTDDCTLGMPSNTPIGEGSPCNQGGQVCNAAGDCVECVDGMDCVSTVCDVMTFTCSPASCSDMVKNGSETATDCGGSCPGCALGQACMAASDCLSNSCVGLQCAPSCTDGMQNQTESDTDCGGTCAPCATGLNCNAGSDCETGHCDVGGVCACSPVCACHLVISEIRTRGATGNDEAIELFNPLNVPVVMDDKWLIEVRSSAAGSYGPRWVGSALNPLVIPPKGHLLIAKAAVDYTGSPAADAFYTTNSGIADAASVVLKHDGQVVDAICFGVTAGEIAVLVAANGYACEGPAFDKSSTQDTRTLERKPGGANGGSCTDTDSSTADFIENLTPNFQNLSSPPTP